MIHFVVLNITSYKWNCPDADHHYGNLYLCELKIPIEEVDQWTMSSLGKKIEVYKEMTLEDAKALDAKDHGHTYQRGWHYGERKTTRFNSEEEVLQRGIEMWRELNLNCPFINLYEAEKYEDTKILT